MEIGTDINVTSCSFIYKHINIWKQQSLVYNKIAGPKLIEEA